MSIVVNTNTSSTLVQTNLSKSATSIQTSLQRLSSGARINKAADDAAGLSISQGLTAQINGSAVASNNAQQGINLLQTAEGDLSVIQNNLQRVRDLTVQAANGTYGTAERNAIKSEVQARIEENDRIASVSKFNKIQLLNGKSTGLTLQIGVSNGSNNTLKIGGSLTSAASSKLGLKSILSKFDSATHASSYVANIDSAIAQVSTQRAGIGALQNRLDSTISSLGVKSENLEASNSNIRDVDIAKEAANLTKNQILQQASASLLSQANQAPGIALSLI
ncbi:MAG: flagellin [Candidatus Gastranaerophilaceae bacterium]|jgi:flagellin